MNADANDLTCRDLKIAGMLFAVFLAAGFALYYPGLHAPAYYDSVFMLSKQALFAQHDIGQILGIFPQRPLPILSFYANYLLGGVDPAPFRIVNIVLLALTALALWRILELLLDMPGTWQTASPRERTCISVAVSLLFLVHPYQVFVTLYIWQRMALLACLFGYWSLAVYVSVRLGKWRHPSLGYGLCLLLFVMACLSKENSVVLPTFFILAEIAFFGARTREVIGRSAVYGVIVLILIAGMSLVEKPHAMATHQAGILSAVTRYYVESGCTVWQVILMQCRVFFQYLGSILLPLPESLQLIRPQVLSTSIVQPATTMSGVVGLLAFVAVGIYGLFRRPLVGFGMLFFFIALIPEAILVPQYAFFGYRAVFPLLGMGLILADIGLMLLRRGEEKRLSGIVQGILILVWAFAMTGAAYSTLIKAIAWNDPVAFWRNMVLQFPAERKLERIPTTHVLFSLGVQQAIHGDPAGAAESFRRAVTVSPGYVEGRFNLGKALIQLGKLDEATVELKKAIELSPDYWEAHNTLGVALAQAGKISEAIPHFRKAVELNPNDVPSRNNLEMALKDMETGPKPQQGREQQ
jgi:hypothetical protein